MSKKHKGDPAFGDTLKSTSALSASQVLQNHIERKFRSRFGDNFDGWVIQKLSGGELSAVSIAETIERLPRKVGANKPRHELISACRNGQVILLTADANDLSTLSAALVWKRSKAEHFDSVPRNRHTARYADVTYWEAPELSPEVARAFQKLSYPMIPVNDDGRLLDGFEAAGIFEDNTINVEDARRLSEALPAFVLDDPDILCWPVWKGIFDGMVELSIQSRPGPVGLLVGEREQLPALAVDTVRAMQAPVELTCGTKLALIYPGGHRSADAILISKMAERDPWIMERMMLAMPVKHGLMR